MRFSFLFIKKIGVYNSIPILNTKGNIIKILELASDSNIEIANQSFNKYLNPLIIAEIGNNHNGSIERAFKLIDLAKRAKLDAVKFQVFNPHMLVTKNAKKANFEMNT